MMRQIVSTALGLCVSASAALAEVDQGVVVELYTSQGCSSCPPADDLMAKLAETPGVIALALHVDYWDYIGWEDTFAQPGFTERQKAYAHAAGEKMIYTPQMIVGGVARVEGNQPEAVQAAIAAAQGPGAVKLALAREGGQLVIRAEANPPLAAGATVQVVQYLDESRVDIDRGENAGLSVAYHNVVTSWQTVGDWAGVEPLQLVTEVGAGPVVVIVQSAGPAKILAAARLR